VAIVPLDLDSEVDAVFKVDVVGTGAIEVDAVFEVDVIDTGAILI
jgi:hypothetical protein